MRNRTHHGACLLLLLAGLTGCGEPGDTTAAPEELIRQNILGTAYLGQQKWAEAEQAFQQALDRQPDDSLLLNNKAVALIQQGRIDPAEALLRQAIDHSPHDPYAHYNLGTILKNRGEFETAATQFEAVEAFDPDDLMTHYNLGMVYSRIGREEESETQYRRALEIDPTHVSSLYALGRLLLQRGDQQQGVSLIARSQEIRARSGLDEAVGSQYGEQGPYAMGADYPGDALAAPPAVEVVFNSGAAAELPAGRAPRGFTVGPRPETGAPVVFLVDGSGALHIFGRDGLTEPWPLDAELLAIAAGDIDNDGTTEIVGLAGGGGGDLRALVVSEDGVAREIATPYNVSSPSETVALTMVDSDHDGDLDLFLCWNGAAVTDCAIGTNDGTGSFEILGAAGHGFDPLDAGPSDTLTVGFSDVDNDRDIDLLLARRGRIDVFSNQRDGSFEEISDTVGLGAALPEATGAMTVADVNKDGFMDLALGVAGGTRFLLNRQDRFEPGSSFGTGAGGTGRSVVFDYDNDGFLDLAVTGDDGVVLHRNLGAGEWKPDGWRLSGSSANPLAPLAALDSDADGDLDLFVQRITTAAAVELFDNEGGNRNHFIRIVSRGAGDNRAGIGAKVELLAGALRQKFELTTPLPLHAGLGSRDHVESVRYLWPSGILQDEVDLPADERIELAQLDRKGTSCPLLYAWRDGAWRFVTDFLGGSAIGYLHAPGIYSVPDTDEYIKIRGGLTPASDGSLRLRLNNQLQEVIWFDQAQLVVVDHPVGTEVFADERLMPGPPYPEFALFVSDDVRPIVSAASVEGGDDLTSLLAARDRRYVRNFDLLPFKGYATDHTVELDLGRDLPRDGRIVLLLDGWIDYADSSANLAAHQAGQRLTAPVLSVADGDGGWLSADDRMGFPAGLPKTMAVELTGRFPSNDMRIRIATNMRIYWDQARVMVGGGETGVTVRRLDSQLARLEFGGFPAERSADGQRPFGYDPMTVSARSPWAAHVGRYTAFGDVRGQLRAIDDRFVTTRPGDQIELRFETPAPLPAGKERTYLLFADGFGKDMDPNSAANLHVGPVPFHGMPTYPYREGAGPPVNQRGTRLVLDSPHGFPGAVPQVLITHREIGDP